MDDDGAAPRRHWATGGAVAIYFCWAILLILQNPGLQYDEALPVLGAVHMRNSAAELPLPHDPHTWICFRRRCFPLMTVRYVGAVKEYLFLPLSAIFGAHAGTVRALSMLLGALGIWGLARLIASQVSPAAGTSVAFVMAMNPAYVAMNVFDSGTVSVWMAAFGLVCWTLARYVKRQDSRSAFWLGAAIGFGIWCRANFLWLAVATLLAAAIVMGRRLLLPASRWTPVIAGGLVGGFPFLLFQIVSRAGSMTPGDISYIPGTWREQIFIRMVYFAESILSDRETRAMWAGPSMPDWQRFLFPILVVISCVLCLAVARPREWARAFSFTFLFFGAALFTTRLPVAEHHIVGLLPLAVVMAVLAFRWLNERFRWGIALLLGVSLLYAGSATYWQVAAIQGLAETGGAGVYSDAVFEVADILQRRYPASEIKILGWAFQDNLFVLTAGKIRLLELWYDGRKDAGEEQQFWLEQVRSGGVFLLNAMDYDQAGTPASEFRKALAEVHASPRRLAISQANGFPYAEIMEIQPGAFGHGLSHARSLVIVADPQFAEHIEGFHGVETSGPRSWRWTKRDFSIVLARPQGRGDRIRLEVALFVADVLIKNLRDVTLTVRLANRLVGVEKYSRGGRYVFARDLDPAWIQEVPNRFGFALDKSLPPGGSDTRELGIIVDSAELKRIGQ